MNKFHLLLGCGAALAFSTPAFAQESANEADFYGRIGLYYAGSDTSIQLNSTANPTIGTEVSFENDLEFDDGSTVVQAEVGYHLSDDWAIEAQYFNLSRSNGSTLDRQITVDGIVYPIAADVESTFKSTVYHGKVVWTLAHWDRGELAVMLGAHVTNFEIGIEGDASIGTNLTGFRAVQKQQLAPLPTLGLRVKQAVAEDFTLFAQGEFFALTIDGIGGSLLDAEAGVIWQATRNFGIGASWRMVDYGIDIEKARLEGHIGYELSGPMGFVTFRF